MRCPVDCGKRELPENPEFNPIRKKKRGLSYHGEVNQTAHFHALDDGGSHDRSVDLNLTFGVRIVIHRRQEHT